MSLLGDFTMAAASGCGGLASPALEENYGLDDIFAIKPVMDTSALEAFVECDSNVFHTNQVTCARDLLNKFTQTQLVLLLAEMQSGKTGTFMCTACAMVYYGKVDQVYVFSGVPDTDLFDQLEESVSKTVKHFNKVMGCDLSGKVVALKSSQLETLRIPARTLMVWDESHYAQDTKNRPFKMFQNNGLLVDGTRRTNELWSRKNCYLLTASATPFSEYLDARDQTIHVELTKDIVTLKPGSTYRGVQYYNETNSVMDSWDITQTDATQRRFVNLLREAKRAGKPQYVLLRSRATPTDIKILAEHGGWRVKFYDMKNKSSLDDGWETFKEAPVEDTVIVLKNMGRLGQVIPKEHIAFVFESSRTGSGATDTVLQSLLGRMCGYGPFNPTGIKVYVPASLTKPNELKDKVGSENALKARRSLKLKELKSIHIEHLRAIADDEFAVEVAKEQYEEHVRRELRDIVRDHKESVAYVEASELTRYANMMGRDHKDVPRYAKNIKRSSIDQKATGPVGYSTVPFEVPIALTGSGEGSEWTAKEHCARKMNVKGGARRLTNEDKFAVVLELLRLLEASPEAFRDAVQREEFLCVLNAIVKGELDVSEIVNFGDLNSEKGKKLRSRVRIQESIANQMPYHEAIKVKEWRVNEEQGRAKRLQFQICSKVEDGSDGVGDFDHTHTMYFTGYTYDASEHTKDAHKRMTVPETTCQEAFHHDHELAVQPVVLCASPSPSSSSAVSGQGGVAGSTVSSGKSGAGRREQDDELVTSSPSTWVLIKDEEAFMGLVDTEFPKCHKIRILLSETTIPSTVTSHLNNLCLRNNGRFIVKRVAGRRTTQECSLGVRAERYDVYFHERTKLSIV